MNDSMNKLFNDLASTVWAFGWEAGYDGFMMNQLPEEAHLLGSGVFSEFRQGAWALFLGNIQNKRILNIEGSFGASSLTLERMGADVIALHRSGTLGKAFTSRIETKTAGKIHVVVGDLEERFPFKKGSFDIVCVHNFDLISQLFNREHVNSAMMVRQLSELIKEHGCIYISGVKRSIVEPWNWKRTNVFSSLIYGLHKAGWRIDILFDFYQNIFNPDVIRTFYPVLSDVSVVEATKTFLTSRNFGLIATPKRSKPSKIGMEGVVSRLNENGLFAEGINNKLFLGSKSVARILTKDRLIRLPLSDLGIASCEANRNALLYIGGKSIPFHAPKAMEHSFSPIPFFCEERLRGEPIREDGITSKLIQHYLEQGMEHLNSIYKIKNETKVLDEKEYSSHIGSVLEFIKESIGDDGKRDIERIDLGLRRKYIGIDFPVVVGHGDYKIPNFLIDSKKIITGVVDWDRFSDESPIMVDSILLLSHSGSRSRNNNWIKSILSVPFINSYSNIIQKHMRQNNVNPELLKFYVMLASLHLIKYNGPLNISYPLWQRECITPVVQFIYTLLKT